MNSESVSSNQYSYVPENAKELIWNVFFASRQRGVSLEHHFPWINDVHTVRCIALSCDTSGRSEIKATLVIKKERIEPLGSVGLVGLVCVQEKYRGQGLSTLLMKLAAEYGLQSSLKALILWTTKPGVYRKMGFIENDIDYFGTVKRVPARRSVKIVEQEYCDIQERNCDKSGVPAFANEVVEFSNGFESIMVCKTNRGPSLADWSGDTERVISLIEKTLPTSWQLTSPEGSELVCALKKHGYELDLQPGATRMIRALIPERIPYIPYIGVLNRI